MRQGPAARSHLGSRVTVLLAVGLLAGVVAGGAATPTPASPSQPAASPTSTPVLPTPRLDFTGVPLLAYYYIWFDATSWDRAKSDLPLLGPYSSDSESVMRQHITWAKSAGIDGFIVSWKNTTVLDKRLDTLVRVAGDMNFKLEIIYEGLDFDRNPLPAAQIADDLDYFVSHYAASSVFDLFVKPLVIWSGTWEFSASDIAVVIGPRRQSLLVLGSERDLEGIARLGQTVDGNAYYWSSVNPVSSPDYEDKLKAMGAAVHDAGGLWIAPAAPGLDARLIGGTTVVERQAGQMLERQLDAAVGSLPDAIGLISWNEFSENSQVEPSKAYGDQSLKVIAGIRKTNYSTIGDFDSSAPQGIDPSAGIGRILAILSVTAVGVAGAVIIVRRRKRARR